MHLDSLEITQEATVAPRTTLTPLSCSPNFPRASITRYMHAKHETILNYFTKIVSLKFGVDLTLASKTTKQNYNYK